jgi:hypothetical protein
MMNYIIVSTDENDFSEIWTNLQQPWTSKTKLTITGLTTHCNIVVLDENDFVTFKLGDELTIQPQDRYTNLNSLSLAGLLSELLHEQDIVVEVSQANTLIFTSTDGDEFQIIDCSYNFKLLLGIFNESSLPIYSDDQGVLRLKNCGFFLSTPILYLLSNLGDNCQHDGHTTKVVMRINNSFSFNIPIISNNAEFSTIVQSSALSNVWFKLVDSNFHPIKILSPLYILAIGEGIKTDETEDDARRNGTVLTNSIQNSLAAEQYRVSKLVLANEMVKEHGEYLHEYNKV